MGGLVIETVRPGVQFTPDAAAAFRRAEAQVWREFGRDIDVNSTLRDWDTQLRMYNAWRAYVTGRGPHPGHSKALHPADPLAFHTKGTAVDSDDWRNARIVQILADNGFIRNRLYVPNENHHFEYIRALDKNYGKPAGAGASEEDDMLTEEEHKWLKNIYAGMFSGGPSMSESGNAVQASLAKIWNAVKPINRGGRDVALRQEVADTKTIVAGLEAGIQALAVAKGADPAAILKAVQDGVETAMRKVTFTADVDG